MVLEEEVSSEEESGRAKRHGEMLWRKWLRLRLILAQPRGNFTQWLGSDGPGRG